MLSIIPLRRLAMFSGAVTALLIFLAFTMGHAAALPEYPSETSADAGFARDMQVHHSQAVEMSMLILERSSDPDVRTVAYDIALTQQQQGGQMFAWLQGWGLPQSSGSAPMAWMHAGSHDRHATAPTESETGPMPGLASLSDMDRLRQASGHAADRIFLTLMISHHEGGVTMAEAAAQRATTDGVRSLAAKMVTGQGAEITAMQQMLHE